MFDPAEESWGAQSEPGLRGEERAGRFGAVRVNGVLFPQLHRHQLQLPGLDASGWSLTAGVQGWLCPAQSLGRSVECRGCPRDVGSVWSSPLSGTAWKIRVCCPVGFTEMLILKMAIDVLLLLLMLLCMSLANLCNPLINQHFCEDARLLLKTAS